ncbi:MAG: erythromycin esterase family protein [Planctomycetaceae bacterium]
MLVVLLLMWRERREQRRVLSIAQDSFPVRSIDPADEDFSDLKPLGDAIGSARLVLMGETTHNDGAMIAARTRLLRFLHRKLGFDVVAVEDSYVLMRDLTACLNSDQQYQQFLAAHAANATVRNQRPLLELIRSTHAAGDRPISLMGCSVYYFLDAELITKVQSFLADLPASPLSKPEIERFESILSSILGTDTSNGSLKFGRLTRADAREFDRLCLSLTTAIAEHRAALVQAKSHDEVAWFEGLICSLPGFVTSATMPQPHDLSRDREQLDIRDKAMADLVIHASRELFRDRKIVVMAANAHLLRTGGGFEPMPGVVSMGEHLHRIFGDQIYTLVFDAYAGRSGEGQWVSAVPPAAPGTMADLFHRSGDEFRFLDFRALPADHWLRHNPVGIRASGYRPDGDLAVWPSAADGIFYISEQQPSGE